VVRERYDAGQSATSIARSLGADKRTVRDSLLRTGAVRSDPETRAVSSVLAGRESGVAAARARGASLPAIAAAFDVSTGAVVRALIRAGFAVAPEEIVRRRARERSAGASYFERITDDARAYWLGFIAADGFLCRQTRGIRFGVELARKDADHLSALAARLDLAVHELARDRVAIRSSNTALVHDLRRAGIIERKSSDAAIVLALERCPASLRRHFARGLFDGDGSAFDSASGCRVLEFSGHRLMLERIRAMVAQELGVAWSGLVAPAGRHESFATIRWRHALDLAKLSQWLYTDATVWLQRKRLILDRPLRVRGASIYRGVGRGRANNWHARVGVGGRGGSAVSAGVFPDEDAAARGYDWLVRKLRGPRAALNLPDSPFCVAAVERHRALSIATESAAAWPHAVRARRGAGGSIDRS
jgi:hypothetical protein